MKKPNGDIDYFQNQLNLKVNFTLLCLLCVMIELQFLLTSYIIIIDDLFTNAFLIYLLEKKKTNYYLS